MGMGLGDQLKVTLFGESHGKCIGALVEGIPPGTEIDLQSLSDDLARRRPGRKGMSARLEPESTSMIGSSPVIIVCARCTDENGMLSVTRCSFSMFVVLSICSEIGTSAVFGTERS